MSTNPVELSDEQLKKDLKKFLIPKIRAASYRWSERSKCLKQARVSRGLYKCAICGNPNLKNKEFLIDHISPVVPLEGWDGTWDIYISRMFVKAEGFQLLCKPCHDTKTETENKIRKLNRDKKNGN